MQEHFDITDPDGDIIEIRHNYSFGKFQLTIYVDDGDCASVRLSLEQAISLRNEIDRLIENDRRRASQ